MTGQLGGEMKTKIFALAVVLSIAAFATTAFAQREGRSSSERNIDRTVDRAERAESTKADKPDRGQGDRPDKDRDPAQVDPLLGGGIKAGLEKVIEQEKEKRDQWAEFEKATATPTPEPKNDRESGDRGNDK